MRRLITSIALASLSASGCNSILGNEEGFVIGAESGGAGNLGGGGAGDSTGGTGTSGGKGGAGGSVSTGGTGGTGGTATNGGNGGSGGSGTSGGTGGGGGTDSTLLAPMDGWVDESSNAFGIQGAMFGFADQFSAVGMTNDFTGSHACISGTAAKVDLVCVPVAPATDCYGTFWGAAVALNLNQPIDPETMMGVETPLEFDASELKGFSFEISGNVVPPGLRFKVQTATADYCTPPEIAAQSGMNSYLFSDLRTECWAIGGASAEDGKSVLIRLQWQVVTIPESTTPFDFCIENIHALRAN